LERRNVRRELAVERAERGARRGGRAARDEVRDGLGLEEIELVVQKRAQRELAGLGRPRAERVGVCEQRVAHDPAAVAVQLDDVLAGVGARRGEIEHEAAVERLAARAPERAELGVAGARVDAGERRADRARRWAGDPHDRDRAAAGGGGQGRDRVVTLLAHGCSRGRPSV
jgi:hypothetical protein